MVLSKGDFVEIQFTGKIKNGNVFDSNISEDLKEANIKGHPKNFVFPLGQSMFVKGIDHFLIGKDLGQYDISLKPEQAFGRRNPKLIQMIPLKMFSQHKLNPIPGATFNFDGKVAKVLTVSSGRVLVDFNNPLAGKDVEYKVNALRKVDDINEKVGALNDFFFRRQIDFEIKDKNLLLKVPKSMKPIFDMFKDKYEKILDLSIEAQEIEEKEQKIE